MFGAVFRVHGSCGPWPRTLNREPRTEPRTKHPEPRTPPHRNEKRISSRREMDMLKARTLIAGACCLGVVTLVTVHAQQGGRVAALTAMDQIEIQQLVARAHDALYTGAGNGNEYADLFTADGA